MDINSLLGSFNGIVTLVRTWTDFRDTQVVATVKAQLTEKLLQTQLSLSEILAAIIEKDARIADLTNRVRKLETQQTERARYELRKISSGGNVFAYALKPAAELTERELEPPHFICQRCFDERNVKSVLQGQIEFGQLLLRCFMCSKELEAGSGQTIARLWKRRNQ